MPGPWTALPVVSVDCESTGIDPFTARIVQVAAVEVYPDGTIGNTWDRIVDPGVDIPDEAAAIYGITTERAHAEGIAPATALEALAEILWHHLVDHHGGAGIVVYNAPYDVPLIIAEAARHGVNLPPLGGLILDPLALDRQCDYYRRDEAVHFQPVAHTHGGGYEQARQHRLSSRKLTVVAGLYDVELGDAAHDALADATAAARVLWAMVARFPKLGDNTLASLWLKQVLGAEKDRCKLQDYKRQNGDPLTEVVGGWPIPAQAPKQPRQRRTPAPQPATAGAPA